VLSYLSEINLKNSLLAELDAGLKACLALILTVLASVCEKQVSFFIIFLYLLLATLLLGSNFRFLWKNYSCLWNYFYVALFFRPLIINTFWLSFF